MHNNILFMSDWQRWRQGGWRFVCRGWLIVVYELGCLHEIAGGFLWEHHLFGYLWPKWKYPSLCHPHWQVNDDTWRLEGRSPEPRMSSHRLSNTPSRYMHLSIFHLPMPGQFAKFYSSWKLPENQWLQDAFPIEIVGHVNFWGRHCQKKTASPYPCLLST